MPQPLKYKLTSKTENPADVVDRYVERDGVFTLEVEGIIDKAKGDELRNHNIALRKQVEDFEQRFEGIDPVAVRKLAEEKRKLEEAQQLKAGEFERVLESRVKSVKGELEKQLAGVTGERDSLHAKLSSIQIDQAVVTEATKRGLRATAIPDITARARNTFRLVNGVPQAFESDGQTPRAGRDGVAPLSLAEWLDAQVSDAPHLFESNAGGGAAGDGSGGAVNRSGKNPFRKDSWNLTEQMQLHKTDPQLAARLKAAA